MTVKPGDESNHATFQSNLIYSERAKWLAGQILSAKEKFVMINPLFVAPTAADRFEYQDNGDLMRAGVVHIMFFDVIETKGLQTDWTCKEDWPFDDFLVCQKHKWDNAHPKPSTFIVINRAETHYAVVQGSQSGDFYVKNFHSTKYPGTPHHQDAYCIPPDKVLFQEIPERVFALEGRRGK